RKPARTNRKALSSRRLAASGWLPSASETPVQPLPQAAVAALPGLVPWSAQAGWLRRLRAVLQAAARLVAELRSAPWSHQDEQRRSARDAARLSQPHPDQPPRPSLQGVPRSSGTDQYHSLRPLRPAHWHLHRYSAA